MALEKEGYPTPVHNASEIISIIDLEYQSNYYSFFSDLFFKNECPPLRESSRFLDALAEKRSGTPTYSLLSDQEIIILLLSNLSRQWHLNQRESYQKLLEENHKEHISNTRSLMQFLANIGLGITDSCLKKLEKNDLKAETLLELQILNVINAIQEDNTKRLEYWKERCYNQIHKLENINDKKRYKDAVYCLPVLGAIIYKKEPKKFIYQCIPFSFSDGEEPTIEDKYLISHINVYFRNSILQLCKQGRIEDLVQIDKDCYGWSQLLLDQTLNSTYLEECRIEVKKRRRNQQDKDMSKPPKDIEQEIEILVENAKP